jgi:hypothetical protein
MSSLYAEMCSERRRGVKPETCLVRGCNVIEALPHCHFNFTLIISRLRLLGDIHVNFIYLLIIKNFFF